MQLPQSLHLESNRDWPSPPIWPRLLLCLPFLPVSLSLSLILGASVSLIFLVACVTFPPFHQRWFDLLPFISLFILFLNLPFCILCTPRSWFHLYPLILPVIPPTWGCICTFVCVCACVCAVFLSCTGHWSTSQSMSWVPCPPSWDCHHLTQLLSSCLVERRVTCCETPGLLVPAVPLVSLTLVYLYSYVLIPKWGQQELACLSLLGFVMTEAALICQSSLSNTMWSDDTGVGI